MKMELLKQFPLIINSCTLLPHGNKMGFKCKPHGSSLYIVALLIVRALIIMKPK